MRKEILFSLCGLCVLSFSAPAQAQDSAPRYHIQARVDTHAKRIDGREEVTFTNNGSVELKDLYFHIYPNRVYTEKEKDFIQRFAGYFKVNPFPGGFPRRDFQLKSVASNGKALTATVEGKDETLLRVDLPWALKPGEKVNVSLEFSVAVPHQAFGRFGWNENIMQLSRWYPILSVVHDGVWNKNPFYPFHRPFYSEASFYKVELTVPENEVLACSGDWVFDGERANGTKTNAFDTPNPIREFSCAMSPDYKVQNDEWKGIHISSYYLPGDEQRARDAIKDAEDLMQFYTERFGPYPYNKFSIAPVYLGYGGEQMSNLIFINVYAYKLPGFLSRYFDFLVAHETGHQWFYNTVGINEFSQMWLEEGVNSYFMEEYLDHKYGVNSSVLEYPQWIKPWTWAFPDFTFRRTRDFRYKMIARMGYDHAVLDKLESFSEPSSIFSVTYGKGSRILGMLRGYVGEETYAKIFARITKEYQFRNLDIQDFVRICQEESGKDLAWFFDQWLHQPGSLDYAVAGVKGHTVTLVNKGKVAAPATVRVDFIDGGTAEFTWEGRPRREQRTVEGPSSIKRVTIDPDQSLLDIDRVNNSSPRLVHMKLVPLYLGLYDIPLFLPEDGYNLVAGPELANSGVGLKASLQKPYDQEVYAATDYEFGESIQHSRVGYVLKNIMHSPARAGVELAERTDYDGGEEDLTSGKLFLRRELWPAQYGVTDINDHATLYLVRNQTPAGSSDLLTGGREDGRNISYGRRNESIVGTSFHLNRSGPYPDPHQGYQLATLAESAGHFMGATQYFYRSSADLSVYQPVTPGTTLALRAKTGWGYPDDKNLFQLGGMDGLRGYDRKTVRGAEGLLGALEYRFPIVRQCRVSLFDNIVAVDSIGGVAFFDAGQAWFDDIRDARLRKDAGLGLRLSVSIGSFLEKVIVRADIAQAINDSSEDPRFWFGVGQAF